MFESKTAAVMLACSLLLGSAAHAAEVTQTEKLCAGYEKKQIMLEKRMRLGMRSWERPKLQAQLDKVRADRAKFCPKPVSPAAARP